MTAQPFELQIEVRREDVLIDSTPATLAACSEDVRFRAVLEGRSPNDGRIPDYEVIPHFTSEGPPAVTELSLMHKGQCLGRYDREVWAAQARAQIHALVEAQRLCRGDTVQWKIVARPDPSRPSRFAARVQLAPYPFEDRALPDAVGGTVSAEVHAPLLDEIRRRVVESSTVEIGGFLLGRLLRDPARGVGRIEVVDWLESPAGESGASSVHFSFGPRSFLAARERARRRDEGIVGWFHSHPSCPACGEPENAGCQTHTLFFSADDKLVHAAGFSSAHMVALVAGKVREAPATRPEFGLYGWSEGRIVERPFRLIHLSPEGT
ncbi:MAG: Mov34/MPN/PAD-1 family protein [Myxococcota bacterium]